MINELLRRYFYIKLIQLAQNVTGFRPHYKAQYREYLQGPRWFILRNLRLAWDFYTCTSDSHTRCSGPLQVHHRSYEHKGKGIGWAEFWDLQTLCDKHHGEEHGL